MTAATQTFRTADGHRWTIDPEAGQISGPLSTIGRRYDFQGAFGGLPLGVHALEYLWRIGPNAPASTLKGNAEAIGDFTRFLREQGRDRFTAAGFAAWLLDLRGRAGGRRGSGLSETTQRGYATYVCIFAERHLQQEAGVAAYECESARRRLRKAFRGFRRRATQQLGDRAVSPAEYLRLVRAVRMELEESRDLLDRTPSEQAAYDHHALPLLPFVLLAGLLLAVRSAEVNVMNVGDLHLRDGDPWLHVHAPNKPSAHIWLPEHVREALRVAKQWMARYRPDPGPGDPLLMVLHPESGDLVRMDSVWVRNALRVFYAKWFRRRAPDGSPVLYRVLEGERVPFDVGFADYRTAAITDAARHERNPAKLRIFARHKSVATTLLYYVKQTHMEWVEDITTSLAPDAELLRMAMASEIATRADAAAAPAAGALVPGGHCADHLNGVVGCRRSRDCRLCRRFRIHPDRRDYFATDLDRALSEVARAEGLGLKRDVEVHRGVAALNQAILNRIDEYFATMEQDA